MGVYQKYILGETITISRNLYKILNKTQKQLLKEELYKNGIEGIVLIEGKRRYTLWIMKKNHGKQ